MLINGSLQVWQRGTSFAPSTTGKFYTADRWCAYRPSYASGGYIYKYEGNGYPEMVIKAKDKFNTDYVCVEQSLETEDVKKLAGHRLTVSFDARRESTIADTTLKLAVAYRTDKEHSPGTGGATHLINGILIPLTNKNVRHKATFTLPTDAKGLSIRLVCEKFVSTAGYVAVSNIKLEFGDNATNVTPVSYTEELMKCLRYYEMTYPSATNIGKSGFSQCINMYKSVSENSYNAYAELVNYIVPKRITTPTLTLYSPHTGAINTVVCWLANIEYKDQPLSSFALEFPYGKGPNGFFVRYKNISSNYGNCAFHYICDAEIY